MSPLHCWSSASIVINVAALVMFASGSHMRQPASSRVFNSVLLGVLGLHPSPRLHSCSPSHVKLYCARCSHIPYMSHMFCVSRLTRRQITALGAFDGSCRRLSWILGGVCGCYYLRAVGQVVLACCTLPVVFAPSLSSVVITSLLRQVLMSPSKLLHVEGLRSLVRLRLLGFVRVSLARRA